MLIQVYFLITSIIKLTLEIITCVIDIEQVVIYGYYRVRISEGVVTEKGFEGKFK